MPGPMRVRCSCTQCRTRSLIGPIMIITIGVIFLLGEYTRYGFWELWPVILIVAGVLAVCQAMVSGEGHVGS